MLMDTFAFAVILAAGMATVLLVPRAVPRRSGRRGLVVEDILGRGRLRLLGGGGERVEVRTARDLPVSIGDRVRLARRARLVGVTLIPLDMRRFGKSPRHGGKTARGRWTGRGPAHERER